MDAKDGFQKYLDAGIAFTNLTRAKAEELVAELVHNGEFQGHDARARVDELLERSRKSREAFTAQVRHEVAHQLENVGISSLEDLAQQVAALIGRTADAGKSATSGTKGAPAGAAEKGTATAKKSAATKGAAKTKKSTAKKSTAKKSTATKSTATKSTAKKSAATKSTAKKSTAKKSTAKKAAAKSSAEPATDAAPTGSSD